MKTIGGFLFPETPTEVDAWRPTVSVHALAVRVLVVARTRIEGKWAAYCNAVPGMDHDAEIEPVLERGCKLREIEARAMFPRFADVPYAK